MVALKELPQKEKIYYVTFEEYLQPKRKKCEGILLENKQTNILNINCSRRTNKKAIFYSKFASGWQKLCSKIRKFNCLQNKMTNRIQPLPIIKEISTSDENDQKINYRKENAWKFLKLIFNLFGFLRERKDDGLCKRKTGFEIYCEMSSVHGFANFVGAKTWQRIFWITIISIAILMSLIIVIISQLKSIDKPTIVYTQSTTHPVWTIPFPAITICNLNRISKRKLEELRRKQIIPRNNEILEKLLYIGLYGDESDENDVNSFDGGIPNTTSHYLNELSPDCEHELLRCKWKGILMRCDRLFRKIATPQGLCCTFNYFAAKEAQYEKKLSVRPFFTQPQHSTSCGFHNGLTVLLNANVQDYGISSLKMPGYQVLVHDPYDFPDHAVKHRYVTIHTESTISITPQSTSATEYLHGLSIHRRRCYFPHERQLVSFREYTQSNCLFECRSQMIFRKCSCVPSYMADIGGNWSICNDQQITCVRQHNDILTKILIQGENENYKIDNYAERFICDCYPECNFNQYISVIDSATLNRSYSFGDQRFFQNINITDEILLHIFFKDLIAEKLRLDVSENWLSFVGTFGGIAGLYMGYSFVSGFEMIFFAFIRPACNWLTKQKIRYRIKRRQKKANKAKETTVK